MAIQGRTDDLESRVSRLEGVIEQINLRLEEINTRMNVQIGLTFAVWATVTAVLLAVLFKG